MKKSVSGFTIVELLIVIVVIAVLATISVVAYNGVQARTRDSIRYADAKEIMKALERYKVDHGSYPPTSPTTAAGLPEESDGCSLSGYSYSWATDGTWLKPLVDGGYLKEPPTPPDSSCSHAYRYLRAGKGWYSCTTREHDYYVLTVDGTDGVLAPSDEISSETSSWKPCPEAVNAAWGHGKNSWAFTKDDI